MKLRITAQWQFSVENLQTGVPSVASGVLLLNQMADMPSKSCRSRVYPLVELESSSYSNRPHIWNRSSSLLLITIAAWQRSALRHLAEHSNSLKFKKVWTLVCVIWKSVILRWKVPDVKLAMATAIPDKKITTKMLSVTMFELYLLWSGLVLSLGEVNKPLLFPKCPNKTLYVLWELSSPQRTRVYKKSL